MTDEKIIIGQVETVALPEFQMEGLVARIDTGAATSSIHCKDIETLDLPTGESAIAFTLLDDEHPEYTGRRLMTRHYQTRKVRNAMGDDERYVITSEVVFAGKTIVTEFTLTDRESLTYPVLVGRKLLADNFIVDVSQKFAVSKKPRKRKK